jgi:hypothetical protein
MAKDFLTEIHGICQREADVARHQGRIVSIPGSSSGLKTYPAVRPRVIIMLWMLNDALDPGWNVYRFYEEDEYWLEVTKHLLAFKSYGHRLFFVVGGSGERWGIHPEFDKWVAKAISICRALEIPAVDGLSFLRRCITCPTDSGHLSANTVEDMATNTNQLANYVHKIVQYVSWTTAYDHVWSLSDFYDETTRQCFRVRHGWEEDVVAVLGGREAASSLLQLDLSTGMDVQQQAFPPEPPSAVELVTPTQTVETRGESSSGFSLPSTKGDDGTYVRSEAVATPVAGPTNSR